MVGDLIRLKLTIQRHTPNWKRTLGLVLGVIAALGTWAGAALAAPAARADVLGLILLVWLLGWVVGPILTSGASMLRPEYFTLLPLDRRGLGFGLLASVFVGVGPAVTALGVLSLLAYAVTTADGPAVLPAVIIALFGAVLLVVLIVSLSRVAYAVLGAAMRTRAGVELAAIQYGLFVASMNMGWLIIAPTVRVAPTFLRDGFDGSAAATVLSLLPCGWPLQAIDAAAAGNYPLAVGWLGALAVIAWLAVGAAVSLLTPHVGNRTARRRRRPAGSRVMEGGRILPATPFGAVLGRELRTWWRDPWRSLELRTAWWFGVFVAVYGILGDYPELVGLAGVAVALWVAYCGSNLLGMDGTALWHLVVGQSARAVRAEIRGRQVALVLVLAVPAFGLSALTMLVTGVYDYAVPIVAVIVAFLGAGSGFAMVMAVVGVTPGVEPHRRVNATDAGENTFATQIAFVTTVVLVAPTLVMATLLVFDPPWVPSSFAAATMVVALINAVVVGGWLGEQAIRRLGTHLPETFARLRYPGMAVSTTRPGTGLLDTLSRRTEAMAKGAGKG
ncbi:MAG: hypothetical protein M3548_16385 [Actinomycetota bacterium]|nr:hypothetical protein [Actinomycetota bacterium]